MSDTPTTTPPTLTVCIACPSCNANIHLPAQLVLSRAAVATEETSDLAKFNAEYRARERELQSRVSHFSRRTPKAGRWYTCVLCGGRVYFNAIDHHYGKKHKAELMGMPAEAFAK